MQVFGERVYISDNQESNISIYEFLLKSCILYRAESLFSQETVPQNYINNILGWLKSTDFYSSPASTKYHDSCFSGLLIHSLNVYNEVVELIKLPKFQSVNLGSAVLVALSHDWCKLNTYESYIRNVKDSVTGTWIQQTAYRFREDGIVKLGHGPQSMVMVMQVLGYNQNQLTFEEMAALRWHMYTWDVTTYDAPDLRECNERIPIVHLIQFADQLAVTKY